MKNLIKSNGVIYTINQDGKLIQPSVSNPPVVEDYNTYGLDTLTELATPNTKVVFTMAEDKIEGEGKVCSQVIVPFEWQNLIINMRVV